MKTNFGAVALVGLALGSAMSFYAVSLHVAAERAGIDKVRAETAADRHDIRMLQAELRTRARLPELQRWNEQVLALAPPKPGQFLDSPLVLARYAVPAAGTPPVVRYAATAPSAAPAAAPAVQQVAYLDARALPARLPRTAPEQTAGGPATERLPADRARLSPPTLALDASLAAAIDAAAADEKARAR